jgi:hypothetical protein
MSMGRGEKERSKETRVSFLLKATLIKIGDFGIFGAIKFGDSGNLT